MEQNNNQNNEDLNENKLDEPEVQDNYSQVVANPKKNMALLGVVLVVALFAIYKVVFSSGQPKEAKTEVSQKIATIKPIPADEDVRTPVIPKLPEPAPLVAPTPPPPPTVVVAPPSPQIVEAPRLPEVPQPRIEPRQVVAVTPPVAITKDDAKNLDSRKKSSIILGAGGKGGEGGKDGDGKDGKSDGKKQDQTLTSADLYFQPAKTSAQQQKATILGSPAYTVAQGKVIDAVLESAINTDLPGTVRAVITRDVYAEAGKNILVPKGSRLIGTYAASGKIGQSRVSILWQRLIRPDGIDMMVDSSGVDNLGRAGLDGLLDNKFLEVFGNAILLSSINVGLAIAADKITNAQATTTVSSTNAATGVTTSSSTGKTSDYALQDAVTEVGNVGKQFMQDSMKATPTITIDQGTLIKVFVNRDLIFPANLASNIKVVQ